MDGRINQPSGQGGLAGVPDTGETIMIGRVVIRLAVLIALAALAVGAWPALGGAGREAAREIAVTDRVLRASDLPGFRVGLAPRVAFDPVAFAKLLAEPAEARRLARAGFARGVWEFLKRPNGIVAYSITYEYGSARTARKELARLLAKDAATPDAKARPLSVPGIPGARGLSITFNDGVPQHEVYFADGRFLYFQTTLGHPNGPSVAPEPLIAASRRLYARVRGTGVEG